MIVPVEPPMKYANKAYFVLTKTIITAPVHFCGTGQEKFYGTGLFSEQRTIPFLLIQEKDLTIKLP